MHSYPYRGSTIGANDGALNWAKTLPSYAGLNFDVERHKIGAPVSDVVSYYGSAIGINERRLEHCRAM